MSHSKHQYKPTSPHASANVGYALVLKTDEKEIVFCWWTSGLAVYIAKPATIVTVVD